MRGATSLTVLLLGMRDFGSLRQNGNRWNEGTHRHLQSQNRSQILQPETSYVQCFGTDVVILS